jgi:hypothetical protein
MLSGCCIRMCCDYAVYMHVIMYICIPYRCCVNAQALSLPKTRVHAVTVTEPPYTVSLVVPCLLDQCALAGARL